MATLDRILTVDEFAALAGDDAVRHELVEGLVLAEPRPAYLHGAAQARITTALDTIVRRHGLGQVVCESGFVLARDPDTVRGPDVAFVSRQRLSEAGGPSGFIEGAPDLAVEICSPSDRPGEIRSKVADYLAAGARQVWVVDIERRQVVVYLTLLSPRTLSETDVLDGGDLLPGFGMNVGEFLGE